MLRTVLVLVCATLPMACDGAEVDGQARVVDGDTLRIGVETVRLEGIDAPESRQRCRDSSGQSYSCGAMATQALRRLVESGPLTCRGSERDRYGRLLATCETAGVQVNRTMVQAGWALAFRRYSRRYVAEEREASAARRGMWSGSFQAPWSWRAEAPAQPAAQRVRPAIVKAPGGDCRIKGNVSGSGRIYHVPGSRHYAETRINPARGERWFCSEDEARRAGWRAPRG